jgi:hypothetical protein
MHLVGLYCADLMNGKIESLLNVTGAFYCKYITFIQTCSKKSGADISYVMPSRILLPLADAYC